MLHIFLGAIGIAMTLASSVAGKFLIDAVISFDSGVLGLAAALMVGMRLGSILMKSAFSRIGAGININIQNKIQEEIYGRILDTDWQSLEKLSVGDLLERVTGDVSTVSGSITGLVPSLVSSVVQLCGAFLIILYYDSVMALIALIGIPLTGIASTLLVKKMRRRNREMKDVYSNLVSFQQDSLQNITSIKAFGITGLFRKNFEKVQDEYRKKYLDYSKFSVWTSALMSLLGFAAYIGCFGWGVYRLWNGAITYGEMTMFMQLSTMLGAAFSSLAGLVPSGISATTSARRIMNVVQLPNEVTEPEEGFAEENSFTVSLQKVCFRYDGGEPVLNNIDFTAKPGELVSVSGPSGEGKTTLLRTMLGLITPSEGLSVLVGESGKKYKTSAATRHAFSYVPQNNAIFSGTVAQNLRISNSEATDEELVEALKIACAFDFVMAFPEGIEHVIGGRDKRLSEGQAQRIAVARAILKKAPILLLDEATSALDTETEAQMLKNLMESNVIKTCVFVTHRSAPKSICKRSYYIVNGNMLEES